MTGRNLLGSGSDGQRDSDRSYGLALGGLLSVRPRQTEGSGVDDQNTKNGLELLTQQDPAE